MDPAKVREEISVIKHQISSLPPDSAVRVQLENTLLGLERDANRREAEQVREMLQALPADSIVRNKLEETLAQLEGKNDASNAPNAETKADEAKKDEDDNMIQIAIQASLSDQTESTDPRWKVVARITPAVGAGRCVPKKTHAALALACHCLLLEQGFVCTGSDETAAAVKGFAAPIRDVPARFLVPAKWDADETCVALRYRYEGLKGKVYVFKSLIVGTTAMLHFGEKETEIVSSEVDPAVFIEEESLQRQPPAPDRWFKPLQELAAVMGDLSKQVLPVDKEENVSVQAIATEPAPAPIPTRDPLQVPSRSQPAPLQQQRDPLRDYSRPSGGPGTFGGDLDPFRGGGIGAGGLMGPNHPFFTGPDPSGGLPQPRFDPYGPSPGPDHLPAPGLDPNQFPGRGRGRGRAPRQPFGSINPDHFQPPGSQGNHGSDMFM